MRRSVPIHIALELRRFDPSLRLRWSIQKRKFLVERKCFRQLLARPVRYSKGEDGKIVERRLPELADRRILWRDGYVEIFSVPELDRRLFRSLYDGDCAHYKDVVKEQEERERRVKEKIDKDAEEELYHTGGDAYDSIQWKTGARSGVCNGKTVNIKRL